jgi:hypothetical protein
VSSCTAQPGDGDGDGDSDGDGMMVVMVMVIVTIFGLHMYCTILFLLFKLFKKCNFFIGFFYCMPQQGSGEEEKGLVENNVNVDKTRGNKVPQTLIQKPLRAIIASAVPGAKSCHQWRLNGVTIMVKW